MAGLARQRIRRPEDYALSERYLEPIVTGPSNDHTASRLTLINDCRDQPNYGASALIEGLITVISRCVPDVTMVPVPSHWLLDKSQWQATFEEGGRGLRQPVAKFPQLADQFETIADKWSDGSGGPGVTDFLDRLTGSDLVVLNGEGSIYRANQSAIKELFLAWLSKERLGIPTVFLNGMVHLTDVLPVLPAMVRKTFTILDAVALREPYSLRNLRQFAPDVDARVFPDSAFVFGPDHARSSSVVRAIRDELGAGSFFCFDPGPMPIDAGYPKESGLYDLISTLKEVVPEVVFVSTGPADRFIQRVAGETDSLYVDSIAGYREYMALVEQAEFIVTGRYHNPILAAIMGCPSISLASTSHKVHGACEMLDNVVGMPYDGTHLRPQLDSIRQQASSYVQHREQVRSRLQEVCERRRVEVLQMGEVVKAALRPRTT